MGVDHLGGGGLHQEIQRLWRELRRVAKATLQNGAIGRAGLRVYDGGWIRIEGGGLSVTGTADVSGYLNISGELNGTGTFAWSGPLNITGNVTSAGTLTQTGPWNLNGAGKIAGNVDVTGTIRVLAGGKIQVGNIIIDPTISGGAVAFANGAQVFTDGTTIQVYKGNSVVQVSDSYARLQYGGSVISIGSAGVQMSGMEARTTADTGLPVGTLGIDGSTVFRVIL